MFKSMYYFLTNILTWLFNCAASFFGFISRTVQFSALFTGMVTLIALLVTLSFTLKNEKKNRRHPLFLKFRYYCLLLPKFSESLRKQAVNLEKLCANISIYNYDAEYSATTSFYFTELAKIDSNMIFSYLTEFIKDESFITPFLNINQAIAASTENFNLIDTLMDKFVAGALEYEKNNTELINDTKVHINALLENFKDNTNEYFVDLVSIVTDYDAQTALSFASSYDHFFNELRKLLNKYSDSRLKAWTEQIAADLKLAGSNFDYFKVLCNDQSAIFLEYAKIFNESADMIDSNQELFADYLKKGEKEYSSMFNFIKSKRR